MADYIGRLVYEITGDTSGMARSLGEARGSASVFSTFMGGWAVKLAGIIGSAFAINKLVDWNKKMLEAASAANETASRFGGTFATAIKKANAAVSDLTSQYGFSTQAAQDAMSATGGLVKTLGATDDHAAEMAETVAKLGADMASYVNYAGGAKGAADALTRALLGETDAAKGLSLSLGDESLAAYARSMGKTVDSLNSVEKAQLRLNLAMSQASAMGAVGDMIKTAAGYANTLRAVESKIEDAEAKAGQKLIPAVTELAREFGNAVAPGGAFSGVLDDIASAGAGAASVLAGLLKKLNEVSLRKSIELMKEDVKGYQEYSEQILNKYRGEKQLLEQAAKTSNAAKYDLSKYNEYQKKLEESKNLLKELQKQQDSEDRQAAKSKLGEKARQQASQYSSAYAAIQGIAEKYRTFTRDMTAAQKERADALSKMTPEMFAAYKIPDEVKGWERDYLAGLQETTKKAVANIRELDKEQSKLEKEYGITVDFTDNTQSDKPKPRMGPTSGKSTGTVKAQNKDLEIQVDHWNDIADAANQALASIGRGPAYIHRMSEDTDELGSEYDQLLAKIYEIDDAMQTWGSAGIDVINGLSAATSAYYDARLAGLDAQMQAELEAAGVAEETAVEKAQKELDAALKSGDKTLIEEKKKALTKAKIEEEYDKKRSALEFKAAMREWQYQEAIAITNVPLAISKALASAPTPYNFVLAAMSGAAAGLQLAAVSQSKPKKSNYAEGGIVPGSMYTGDKVQANVNSGEMILNSEQQMQLWKAANGSSVSGGVTHIHFHVADKEVQDVVLSGLYDATANGQAMVHPNGIAAR
ncbi:MAG TPA: hypothetical protein PKL77_07230 [Candidatus Omnitrophota bacterium]|nr:hypothetical protein [Candidatus Omnitrophota bacterium]